MRVLLVMCCLAALSGCGESEGTADSGVRKIAFLRAVATPDSPTDQAFMEELARRGFVEGLNLTVIGGQDDEAYADPEEAEEAVRRWSSEGVDIILAYSTTGAVIAREHAPSSRILFLVNDPTAAGFVKDESRPNGSMTGVTFRVPADRMLSIAQRILPALQRVGLPYPPSDPAAIPSRDQFVQAAQRLNLEMVAEPFSDQNDVARAVGQLVQAGRAQLLLASVSPTATRALPQLADAADAYRVPFAANVATDRALLTLSPDGASIGQQLGRQAARLLNGATPAAVPVENPRRFQLTLNEKVALQLGIPLPAEVVREADVVHR
ncbi:MAG TPA: ABC transporter substrate-binding protein [Actinomycetota bacterium]|nr:ABC transporter substrate-binding protein [Actinomycetota bacterium]